ncbi:MAG: hypothetical protein H7268_02530 [Sandarakinorhabdus sp.]|nr:hypothetical protein [Sandarakinorhabdus sp.]
MATIVLGALGRAFGGPLGGIIGTAVGGIVDRGLLGGSGSAPRTGNLTVQSAAYGEPIPVISGRIRAAGNLIWTSGLREVAGSSGGKRNGASTSDYHYTASFAVGLAARTIAGVGRIWADGRLIRNSDGTFLAPTIMRLHPGTEAQTPDPLIAAAEGIANAPAYRGMAYAVFEDLALGDFGNRIPNLTFEIDADGEAEIDIGQAIANLAVVEGRPVARVAGNFPKVTGHFAGTSGGLSDTLASLIGLVGGSVAGIDEIEFVGGAPASFTIPEDECQTRLPADVRTRDRLERVGGVGRTDAVEISYYDSALDFQPGLQRARRAVGGAIEHIALSCAMSADQAKSMAHALLVQSQAKRLRTTVRLPWRYLWLKAGDQIKLGDDCTAWRIRSARFEGFIIALDLERVDAVVPVAVAGASGRAFMVADFPAGPTTIHMLDLPLVPGEPLAASRVLAAVAGESSGWRGSGIAISIDNGASYVPAGRVDGGTIIGVTTTSLPLGPVAGWDRSSVVEVALLSDRMWLESRPEASVLAGANLALIGDEIVQFSVVEAVAPRRFRLSGLLRGRRGTESRALNHRIDERFVLLDLSAMISIDLPTDLLGREVRVRAMGVDDEATTPVQFSYAAHSLKPLAPVDLKLSPVVGGVLATWSRRSRDGYAWLDGIDAPLAEASEAYQVAIAIDGEWIETVSVASPTLLYLAEHPTAAGARRLSFSVRQVSARVGPGEAAEADLVFNSSGEMQ